MRWPEVSPRPSQLIGFPTHEEACEAQRVCLDEPIEKVKAFMESLRPDAATGGIIVINHDDPEPPTPGGRTMWFHRPLTK